MLFGVVPGPADPGHPRRLPGHRHARLRRDHPASWPARTCSSRRSGGPRGILNIPKPIDVPPDALLAGPDPDLLHRARLRGGRRLRRLAAARLAAGTGLGGHPRGRGRGRGAGVNLVQTKLLAYMLGAAFAGLGGAIFAALVGPCSQRASSSIVSINVVAIIIVGGMGSIPGVVVGASSSSACRSCSASSRVSLPVLRHRADRDHALPARRACCRRGSRQARAARGSRTTCRPAERAGRRRGRGDAERRRRDRRDGRLMRAARGGTRHQALRRPGRGQRPRLHPGGGRDRQRHRAQRRRQDDVLQLHRRLLPDRRGHASRFDGAADPRPAARPDRRTSGSAARTRTSACSRA